MKKFILSAIAATAGRQPDRRHRRPKPRRSAARRTVVRERPNGRTVVTRTHRRRAPNQYRNWRKGQRFDRRYAQNYRQIDYRQLSRPARAAARLSLGPLGQRRGAGRRSPAA